MSRLWDLLSYLWRSRRYQDDPFVRQFIRSVLDIKKEYYAFTPIELRRSELLKDSRMIDYIDHGVGGRTGKRSISDIARKSLSSKRQGRLLFNMVNYYQPRTILELGASLGISTAYMSSANSNSVVVSLEGNPDSAIIARQTCRASGNNNVSILTGTFKENLATALQQLKTVDFAFIDGHHDGQATIDYYNEIVPYSNEGGVVVLDDIYWSGDMKGAWQQLAQDAQVKYAIDLFDLGVLVLGEQGEASVKVTLSMPLICE